MLPFEHPSVVYVMAADENGPCKIGKTSKIKERHAHVQIGSFMPLAVYGVRVCLPRGAVVPGSLETDLNRGAYTAEAETHKALRKLGLGMCGEWFDVTAQEALRAIEKAAKEKEIATLGLDALLALQIPDEEEGLVKVARQRLLATLTEINAFCHETIDKAEGGA